MADKGLNLCEECAAAESVHLCSQEDKSTSSSLGDSKMYTSSTIMNSQRTQTKINKIGAIAKERILVEQVIL